MASRKRRASHALRAFATLAALGAGLCAQSPPPNGFAFVGNRGQWDPAIAFQARSGPATLWFHDAGVALALEKRELQPRDPDPEPTGLQGPPHSRLVGRSTVRMSFVNARTVVPSGLERQRGTMSYVQGSDPSGWVTGVPTFGALRYEDIQPGIDAVFRTEGNRLVYDFHAGPGVSSALVELRCEGIDGLSIRDDGALVMRTEFGDVVHSAPRSFELGPDGERVPVDSRFALRGADRFGFAVDRIDPSRALVIDPGIDWSTYMGGGGIDAIFDTATITGRTIVVSGASTSTIVPPPWNSNTGTGAADAMVAVIDTTQTGSAAPVWTALIGGSLQDLGMDVTFDPSTQLVTVVGITESADFPATANAYQSSSGGQRDGFIAQFDMSGGVSYSTYVGTTGVDRLMAVSASSGLLTIGGYTDSSLFPMVGSPFQPGLRGSFDVVLMQFGPSLPPAQQIVASTYLGSPFQEGLWDPNRGSWNWDLLDLCVAGDGSVTMTTRCTGTNFPTTANAYQPAFRGGANADFVIARLDPQLSQMIYGTYLGSFGDDGSQTIHVDDQGIVTLAGITWGNGLPTTSGAVATSHAGNNDMYVARLDPGLPAASQLLFGSYLGGSGYDEPSGLVVDPSGMITFVGGSDTATLPTTAGAHQPGFAGDYSGVAARIAPFNGASGALHYLSYVGHTQAPGFTFWWSAVAAGDGRVILGGQSSAQSFSVTPGAPQGTMIGNNDAVMAVMDLLPDTVAPLGASSPACAPISWMQVNSQPQPGNATFEFLCESAPPGANGILALGLPDPRGSVAVFGATLYAGLPFFGTVGVVSDARGFALTPLGIPGGVGVPLGIAAQYVWLAPGTCGGAVLRSSRALSM